VSFRLRPRVVLNFSGLYVAGLCLLRTAPLVRVALLHYLPADLCILTLQLLGVLWNWCLYGALAVQLCELCPLSRNSCRLSLFIDPTEDVYSYNFPGDRKSLKLLGMQMLSSPFTNL
jgi:hypothetical protein